MSKYRFKTKEEFIRDGLWNDKYNCPDEWAWEGQMNKYLGIDVPDEFNLQCDENESFEYNDWYFQNTDYTLKEQQKYFNDLSQHIGRYIRALVDNPHQGSGVYKGNIGKIIDKDRVDFPDFKRYHCTCALDKNNLGIKYELLPEDYSPEQEVKESNVEFIPGKWYKYNRWYIKYKEHIDGVWRSSEEIDSCKKYREKESSFGDRDSDDKKILLIDLSEIQDFLPEGHPDKVKNFKLEVGKWYSFNWDWSGKYRIVIAKIKEVTDIDIIVSWRNYTWKKNDYNTSDGYNLSEISNIKELSIDDIQQYLPDGHPDKITKQKFEIGKWYKWYQKNHGKYHHGKVEKINLETDTLAMSPWIIQCDEYQFSGYFALSEAEQIQEISVEEVQEFLPKNHSDKITSSEFKKGEYIVITDKFDSWVKDFISNYIYKQRKDSTYLQPEYDSLDSITNGWAKYTRNNSHNWRYATQEEINEYERRGKPYDVTELQKKELSMKEIQEECKKRFPIGCTYINTDGEKYVLEDDPYTYVIANQNIWAHSGAGCLYQNGKWAELVSLPEENITEVPEYVECFKDYGEAIKGKVYKTTDKNEASRLFGLSWKKVLIDFNRLKDGSFKISNKEAYEKQKSHIPEYIECTETKEYYFIKGNIYKVIDSSNLSSAKLVSNIDLCELAAGSTLLCSLEFNDKKYWKPSTKEAYEQQKSWLGTSEELIEKFAPIIVYDPSFQLLKSTSKDIFIHDEVGQYLSTSSDYWKEIPKFVEQDFDIYGPTPDIE